MVSKFRIGVVLLALFFLIFHKVYAASTPDLGQADSFGILSSTYTNTVSGSTIDGDLGYTTGPAVDPTVDGTTYIGGSVYDQAGTDQAAALVSLNAQDCDFTFGSATDLSLEDQPLAAGVYCMTGAVSIGTGGITLSESGTYIFRITGALDSVANSSITINGDASVCNVFWTPSAATTLGADSTFQGTIIDASGITIGHNVTWTGRALAYGGTVSTNDDTINVPNCDTPTSTPTPTGSPTPTPTPTSSPSSNAGSSIGSEVKYCSPLNRGIISPIVIEAKRIDKDSIFIKWAPYSGINTFNVQYGFENGKFLYNTDVTGFSTTINDLKINQPIWVRVAARNDCEIGTYGEAKYTGAPSLPNTGFAPKH